MVSNKKKGTTETFQLFLYHNILKNSKKLFLKAMKKAWWDGKSEMKSIMWFMILTTRYESNTKPIVWSGSEKLMSVKIHVLKKNACSQIL